jgi:hypothetical protein
MLRDLAGDENVAEAYGVLRDAYVSAVSDFLPRAFRKSLWQIWTVIGIIPCSAKDERFSSFGIVEGVEEDTLTSLRVDLPRVLDEAARAPSANAESLMEAGRAAFRPALEAACARALVQLGLFEALRRSTGGRDSWERMSGHVRARTGYLAEDVAGVLGQDEALSLVRAATSPSWARKPFGPTGLTQEGRRRGDFGGAVRALLLSRAQALPRKGPVFFSFNDHVVFDDGDGEAFEAFVIQDDMDSDYVSVRRPGLHMGANHEMEEDPEMELLRSCLRPR